MPGPRPSPTAAIAQLHAAARRLLRGSVTPEQEKVARNLIAALRNVEHLWLGHPHPDDFLLLRAQTDARAPMPQPAPEPEPEPVYYVEETQEEANERQRLESEAQDYDPN